jgi:hypothetical protein
MGIHPYDLAPDTPQAYTPAELDALLRYAEAKRIALKARS